MTLAPASSTRASLSDKGQSLCRFVLIKSDERFSALGPMLDRINKSVLELVPNFLVCSRAMKQPVILRIHSEACNIESSTSLGCAVIRFTGCWEKYPSSTISLAQKRK